MVVESGEKVKGSQIADASITNADITDATIKGAKLTTPANTRMVIITAENVTATGNKYIFIAPSACVVTLVSVLVATTIAANDTNYWTVQVRNVTQSNDLSATAKNTKTTGGTAITADTVWDVAVDQNLTLVAGDVLEIQLTKSASGSDMVDPSFILRYTVAT